ncbi:MAG TPA: hypothetical protein ENN67_09130 [Firmicutes bacterium]|nr:hypothetical protein [Bacillota bacterium]
MAVRLLLMFLMILIPSGCGKASPEPVSATHELSDDSTPWGLFDLETAGPGSVIETELREPFPVSDDYEWYPDLLMPHDIIVEEFYLTTTNGNQIFADVHRPVWASPAKQCHALVLVPGGLMLGSAWHAPWRKCNSNNWAKAGFIVSDFDFQGRGKSEGEEHISGPEHREDLKSVIEYMASRPDVLPGKIGLISSSWGCTISTSTLATYQELPIRFYIDLEGAHNRHVATQFDDPKWIDIWGGHPTWDNDFWDTREAITYQPHITVPYIRVQADIDHALHYFYYEHAFDMVNAALTGKSPYAQMNRNTPNMFLLSQFVDYYKWEVREDIPDQLFLYAVEASMTKFPGE